VRRVAWENIKEIVLNPFYKSICVSKDGAFLTQKYHTVADKKVKYQQVFEILLFSTLYLILEICF